MLLRGLVEIFCQYGRYLWEHNPIMVLVRRRQRLEFVQSYEEMMIQPRLKEKLLEVFLTGLYVEHNFTKCWAAICWRLNGTLAYSTI